MWFLMSLALAAEPTNHFEDSKPSGGDVSVGVTDAWARDAEAKLKVHLQNDTKDFLLVDLTTLRAELGKPLAPVKAKTKIVPPNKSKTDVLTFLGDGMYVEKGSVTVDGMSMVAVDSPVVKFPDYRLPVESKTFKAKDFSCALAGKVKKETDNTTAAFKCTYQGKGVAIVDESRIQVRVKGDQLFGNAGGNTSASVVRPGESFKLKTKFQVSAKVVDMQFAEMYIQFNDAVRVGEAKPIPAQKVALNFSVEKTEKAK